MAWISRTDAARYSREKQVVEARLAEGLYNKFNSGNALANLRQLALSCIGIMLEDAVPLRAACDIEASLGVWSKIRATVGAEAQMGPSIKPQWLRAFFRKATAYVPGSKEASIGTFTATDVSDIIRLFGQWVEGNPDAAKSVVTDGGAATQGLRGEKETDAWGQRLTPSFAVKDVYRPGVMTGAGAWRPEVEDAWGDKVGRFASMHGAKRRDRGPGSPVEQHIDFRSDRSAFAGMQGKRAQQDSNVLKIDKLFGLIIACDISGTTADTVFALEALGRDYLSAAYYMLPLATIVHNLHHSLIEVALALTLNGVIDYQIGFYTSLLPKTVKTIPRELPGIDAILKQYQDDANNRHVLLYYNNGELAGGYLMSKFEASYLRSAGGLNAAKLLKMAPNLPRLPSQNDLKNLFPQVIPA